MLQLLQFLNLRLPFPNERSLFQNCFSLQRQYTPACMCVNRKRKLVQLSLCCFLVLLTHLMEMMPTYQQRLLRNDFCEVKCSFTNEFKCLMHHSPLQYILKTFNEYNLNLSLFYLNVSKDLHAESQQDGMWSTYSLSPLSKLIDIDKNSLHPLRSKNSAHELEQQNVHNDSSLGILV